MEIIDYSGQIICRGCESEANLSKITENILNQLNCFKNLNIESDDDLPQYICEQCLIELENSCAFQCKIRRTASRLRRMIHILHAVEKKCTNDNYPSSVNTLTLEKCTENRIIDYIWNCRQSESLEQLELPTDALPPMNNESHNLSARTLIEYVIPETGEFTIDDYDAHLIRKTETVVNSEDQTIPTENLMSDLNGSMTSTSTVIVIFSPNELKTEIADAEQGVQIDEHTSLKVNGILVAAAQATKISNGTLLPAEIPAAEISAAEIQAALISANKKNHMISDLNLPLSTNAFNKSLTKTVENVKKTSLQESNAEKSTQYTSGVMAAPQERFISAAVSTVNCDRDHTKIINNETPISIRKHTVKKLMLPQSDDPSHVQTYTNAPALNCDSMQPKKKAAISNINLNPFVRLKRLRSPMKNNSTNKRNKLKKPRANLKRIHLNSNKDPDKNRQK